MQFVKSFFKNLFWVVVGAVAVVLMVGAVVGVWRWLSMLGVPDVVSVAGGFMVSMALMMTLFGGESE